MDALNAHERLIDSLRELRIRFFGDGIEERVGFPYAINTGDRETILLDLPLPGPLSCLDPSHVGFAVLDALGTVVQSWGYAKQIGYFLKGASILETPIAGILEGCHKGSPVVLYLEGHRYFAAPGLRPNAETSEVGDSFVPGDVFILVINAEDEKSAYHQASRNERIAKSLKRLGKVLAVEVGAVRLCVSAAHEIASAAELAAVLIWLPELDSPKMKLGASVGVNRHGISSLSELNAEDGSGCLAELVASTRKPFFLSDLGTHVLSSELESTICYLTPKGLAVFPLIASEKLVGVLEIIGYKEDEEFDENLELFETFAEQLMFALNSAQLYEAAERRASHDALTGLANHKSMQEFLLARISEAERSQTSVGVIMIDVDHFRSFNEEEGHDVGDEVLRLVATAIKNSVRPYDLAARYGGEEFTVVMPGATRDTVEAISERIRSEIEHSGITTSSGRHRGVTASLGYALFSETARDPIGVIKAADDALFQAKRNGRNQAVFYEGVFEHKETSARTEIEISHLLIPELAPKVERIFQSVALELDFLSERLSLSIAQQIVLKALIKAVPTFRELSRREDLQALRAFESASEVRLLLPSLQMLSERFDGRGPKGVPGPRLPLLVRVLHVLLALAEQEAIPLIADPGCFDPEIVGILADLPNAA